MFVISLNRLTLAGAAESQILPVKHCKLRPKKFYDKMLGLIFFSWKDIFIEL